MKISVVTPTARKEPLFREMADSLYVAAQNMDEGEFEWIVVDAGFWYDPDRFWDLYAAVELRFPTTHSPSKVGWHQPRFGYFPTTNAARNTGILYAQGDFVVFLDDCSIVHPNFLVQAIEGAKRGSVIRFPHMRREGLGMLNPPGWGYRRIDRAGLRGSGVGYPLDALLDVNGFDELCDGQRKEDVEIGFRLANLGLVLEEDEGTLIVEKTHELLFPDESASNELRIQKLLSDIKTTLPQGVQTDLRATRKRIAAWKEACATFV